MSGSDQQKYSKEMRKALFEASLEGNVFALNELLGEDPLVLERAITSSSETPLHIAAMLGHVGFAREILSRKPELALELDSEGYSPLHLASARKNFEMVRELVRAAPDVCLSTDCDGRTPLHLAAMKGRVKIMEELFQWRPEALDKVLFDGGETVLHLCMKHSRLEALELLLQWLGGHQVGVNTKDGHGNTILHLAVAKKHIQIIKLLLLSNSSSAHDVEVNALNKSGLTALDILMQSTVRDPKDLEIAEVLRGAGGLRAATEIISTGSTNNNSSGGKANAAHVITIRSDKPTTPLPSKSTSSGGWETRLNEYEKWLEKKQNTVMVVASLIAGIGFQAILNPPIGFNRKVDTDSLPDDLGDYANTTETTSQSPSAPINILSFLESTFSDFDQFKAYLHANSIGVVGSLIVTILVMSGLPLNRRVFIWILMFIMCASIAAMGLSYRLAVSSFIPEVYSDEFHYIKYSWKAMVLFILLMHTTRLLSWMVDNTGRRRRRRIFLWLWCPIAMVALGYLTVFEHLVEFCSSHKLGTIEDKYCIP
ncbi:hypothetical protein Sjap_011815 [Stephania japonica]|uniref:PGG domain-containing protein n=1 Tax=Stephania japonica TaxID=461633 RepID=A0AAP0JE51_9MAGN